LVLDAALQFRRSCLWSTTFPALESGLSPTHSHVFTAFPAVRWN
jgi:hypothetical protein